MALPVEPPVSPMLARLVRDLPVDGSLYEPKWDGLRCLIFRDRDHVEMRSRRDRPFARYFPELVGTLRLLDQDRFAMDGEIVLVRPDGFDFEALLARLHPSASRVAKLAAETPAMFVAFDVLACGDDVLLGEPFIERRRLLERITADRNGALALTRVTQNADVARAWLERYRGSGIDGVIAKRPDLTYQPGARAMTKVKVRRSALCVAAGFRVYERTLLPSSILLGLFDGDALVNVGIASGFGAALAHKLLDDLRPAIVPIEGHPWEHGFGPQRSSLGRLPGAASRWDPHEMYLDWIPLRSGLVCEVTYEQADRRRLRHPARFVAWRRDADARACMIDQLNSPSVDLAELLA